MKLTTALLITLSMMACGGGSGGATRQAACENVCDCLSFSDPAAGADCVVSCTNSASGGVELTTQACIDCAAEATCDGITNGTACAVECDDPTSSSL